MNLPYARTLRHVRPWIKLLFRLYRFQLLPDLDKPRLAGLGVSVIDEKVGQRTDFATFLCNPRDRIF